MKLDVNYKNITVSRRDYVYFGIVAFLFLLVAFALLSDFSFNFFYKTRYGEAYFDMWKRMARGDITISRDVLGGETFIINGRIIPYFLPFPAVIRGFWTLFGIGSYSIPSLLMGFSLYGVAIFLLLKEVIVFTDCKESDSILRAWYPFFLLPMTSLFIEGSIYWEAIIWALAVFILQAFLFINFLRREDHFMKWLLLIVSSLVLFTRPTYGVASGVLVLVLFYLDIRSRSLSIRDLLPYCCFLIALLLLALLNYKRWGNPFEFSPMIYHEQLIGTERGRMAAISKNFSVERIPETFDYYFFVSKLNFRAHAPFIDFGGPILPLKSYFDYKEGYYSITLLLPFFVLASLVGGYALFRGKLSAASLYIYFRLYFFIASIPALLMLMLLVMGLRYRAEFFTVLIFSSMTGITYMQRAVGKHKIYLASSIVTLLSVLFVLNGLFAERYMFFKCSDRNPKVACVWFGNK